MDETAPVIPNLLPSFASIVPVENILAVVFTALFIWWLIFTIVLAYHWIRYARDSWVAVPVLALHLAISGWVFIFSTGGFH